MTAEPTWREFAACSDCGPDLFFSFLPGAEVAAMEICAGCPVRELCLQEAIDLGPETVGVWGGTTQDDRRRIRRRRRRVAAMEREAS